MGGATHVKKFQIKTEAPHLSPLWFFSGPQWFPMGSSPPTCTPVLPSAFLHAWVSKQAYKFFCFIAITFFSVCIFKLCSTPRFMDFKIRYALNPCRPLPRDKVYNPKISHPSALPHCAFPSPLTFVTSTSHFFVSFLRQGLSVMQLCLS